MNAQQINQRDAQQIDQRDAQQIDQWDAQLPPSDFAELAVEAMLASAPATKRASRRWRHSGWLLLAAALVGGTAWGMWRHQPATPPSPARQAETTVTTAAAKVEQRSGKARARPRVAQAEAPTTHPKQRPAAASSVSAAPSTNTAPSADTTTAAPSANVTPPLFAHQPRCVCEPNVMVCSCLD